jgi:hypothetical protein
LDLTTEIDKNISTFKVYYRHSQKTINRIQSSVQQSKRELLELQSTKTYEVIKEKSIELYRLQDGLNCIERLCKMYQIKDRVFKQTERKEIQASIDSLSLFLEIDFSLLETDRIFGSVKGHISNTFGQSYNQIVQLMHHDFDIVLKEISWPKIDSKKLSSSQFVPKLLQFLKLRPRSHYIANQEAIHPVFSSLSQIYETGFHFHFKGKKKTNRLDKVSESLYSLNTT